MPSALSQSHFRFRTDTFAVDFTGQWVDALDANLSVGANNVQIRLRFTLQETGGLTTAGTTCKLQVSRNAGAFQDVTSASTVVQSNTGASLSGNNTLIAASQLTGTGSFVANQGSYSNTGATQSFVVTASNWIEVEYGIWILNTNAVTDTLDFQVVTTAGTTITATLIPRITIIAQQGMQLFQQYVENLNTANPANNTVTLYQQYVENLNTANPANNTVTLYQQYIEVLAPQPPSVLPLAPDWNATVQRMSNGSGRTQAHTARHPIGLAKYMHPATTKFNAGMLIPNEIILEDKWHYGWDQPYYKRAPDRPQIMKNKALRNPAQTYGRELEAPFYTSGNAGFTIVMSNWWQQLSMPRLPRLRGQTIYSKTWPGISQPLAQPSRPDFTVVAQLFVTEQGDLGNFTGSVSGGVGLRVKSAIVGIAPRRPSQAFVGNAKIP